QTLGRLTDEQRGLRCLGDGLSVGLGDIPHVRGLETDQTGPDGLTWSWLLAATETTPGVGVRRRRGGEPCGDRCEDCIAGLTLHHPAVETEPLPEPGHVPRSRLGHPALLVRGVVLDGDQ